MHMRQGTGRVGALVVVGAVALAACASGDGDNGGDGSSTAPTTTVSSYPRDDELRMNEIQLIGTHNSYHRRPSADFVTLMEETVPVLAGAFDYEHRPLTEQLDDLGIRQFELDVFHDPEGTLYSDRKAHQAAGLSADGGIEALHDPGFKVLHVQEIDLESTCWTLALCLTEIETWSDANPWHVPVFVLIEAKADPIPDPFDMGFVPPLPIDAAALDALDAEIRSVFDDEDLITPDFVRGEHDTLGAALEAEGWPVLGEVRGRVMFMLDNGGALQALYEEGHANLSGRVLFTGDHAPGDDNAAFLKRNDPFESDAIQSAVTDGYLVRTRSDGDAHLSSTDPSEQRDTALATGAQFVSTDYPEATLKAFPDYIVRFTHTGDDADANPFVRCNPLVAPEWCTALDVERAP
jgi:hypothetical protein